ncbi:MAG: hypothetical protein JST30_14040 [Armatimonadetes bacterium]|nr:hypothetical protein [Armatimonadota bacterium]
MKNSLSSAVLAAVGIASLSVALPLASARAQDKPAAPPAQETRAEPAATATRTSGTTAPQAAAPGDTLQDNRPRPAAARDRFTPMPDQGRPAGMPMPDVAMPMAPMPQGPAPVMVVDGQFLFILRGNEIYKVNKADLRVVAVGMLPGGARPMMIGPRPGNGIPVPVPGGTAPRAVPDTAKSRRSGGK